MQLAQLNIAESLHPMEDPRMSGFVDRIDQINALADRSDGFVWRLVDDNDALDGALELRLPGSEYTLVNMSVWRDVESLFHFVYKTAHAKLISGREDWFTTLTSNHIVLWWVPDGHIPSLEEAKARLDRLNAKGSAPEAFTFALPFDAQGQPIKPNFPKKDCA